MSIKSVLSLPIKYLKIKRKYRRIKGVDVRTTTISDDLLLEEYVRIPRKVRIQENVSIGKCTYLSPNTIIESNVSIGSYCSIGPNVYIGPGEHYITLATTHPIMFDPYWRSLLGIPEKDTFIKHIGKQDASTIIGNDVWIGYHSTILRGVKVGDGAVIAAGALVTGDVPPYAVVGGIPAKLIRYRFTDEKIEQLQKSKWWEKPINIEWLIEMSE